MTREEAITVFKAFMDNPLFSDIHKAAFNIAIHDIKQRRDWDINTFMNKPCVSSEVCEHDKNVVIDKIRAEIREWYWQADKQALAEDPCVVDAMVDLFIRTINKYKSESEVGE